MRTYVIPRRSNNQSRILYFFTIKGFIYMLIGAAVGFTLSIIIRIIGFKSLILSLILVALFGGIGLAIGELPIPDTKSFPLFRHIGGEKIDDIIFRYIKFRNSKKVYIYGKKTKEAKEIKDTKKEIEKATKT